MLSKDISSLSCQDQVKENLNVRTRSTLEVFALTVAKQICVFISASIQKAGPIWPIAGSVKVAAKPSNVRI